MACRDCQYFDPFAKYCDLHNRAKKPSGWCSDENTWGESDGINYYGDEDVREDGDYDPLGFECD